MSKNGRIKQKKGTKNLVIKFETYGKGLEFDLCVSERIYSRKNGIYFFQYLTNEISFVLKEIFPLFYSIKVISHRRTIIVK